MTWSLEPVFFKYSCDCYIYIVKIFWFLGTFAYKKQHFYLYHIAYILKVFSAENIWTFDDPLRPNNVLVELIITFIGKRIV